MMGAPRFAVFETWDSTTVEPVGFPWSAGQPLALPPSSEHARNDLPLKYSMPDNPLWNEGAQTARLAELTADTADPAKELPLRRDVRSLGILLGRVLVEQEGQAFFDVVEQLRHLLIQHREQPQSDATPKSDDKLTDDNRINDNLMTRSLLARAREIVSSLSVEDAYRITKAFAIYFELTNLAETNHRKRRRRAAPMSFEKASGKTHVD